MEVQNSVLNFLLHVLMMELDVMIKIAMDVQMLNLKVIVKQIALAMHAYGIQKHLNVFNLINVKILHSDSQKMLLQVM